MSNLYCIYESKLWFSSNHNALYGHSEAACTADFQIIFTMFSPFNCPERNVIRARWNEARWRRQLGYGALTSSHTQYRLLCSRVYSVSFESIFLLRWIRVKKCAATSALPALCSLSLCHFLWNTLMWKAPVMCALLIWHEYPMRAAIRGNCLWCKCCFNSFNAVNYSSTTSPVRRMEMAAVALSLWVLFTPVKFILAQHKGKFVSR